MQAWSKKDVVVAVVAAHGGATAVVDTEDVAVGAHRMAPALFSWRKYPEQIDLDAVRVALRHASEERPPRITGGVRAGWSLAPAGVDWTRRTPPGGGFTESRSGTRRESAYAAAEQSRLQKQPSFTAWRSGGSLSRRASESIFRIDGYSTRQERELQVHRLRELIQDPELSAFLDAAADIVLQFTADDQKEL